MASRLSQLGSTDERLEFERSSADRTIRAKEAFEFHLAFVAFGDEMTGQFQGVSLPTFRAVVRTLEHIHAGFDKDVIVKVIDGNEIIHFTLLLGVKAFPRIHPFSQRDEAGRSIGKRIDGLGCVREWPRILRNDGE